MNHSGDIPAAFTVARALRGTVHTFQVYLEPRRVVFIRVGSGPGAEMAAAVSGGLVGGLLFWWLSSRRKRKEQEAVGRNRGRTPSEMLADHKANHAIDLADLTDVSLEPGGWTLAKGTVNWRFQRRGEKKRVTCTFRGAPDVAAALVELPKWFPGMRVDVGSAPSGPEARP